jgi:hypothetical protein
MHEELLVNSSAAALEARVVRALERPPEPTIPADFATRVAAQVPLRKPVSLTPTHYGRRVTAACLALLFVVLLLLTPYTANHTTWSLAVDWLLTAQFLAMVMWLGTWRRDIG